MKKKMKWTSSDRLAVLLLVAVSTALVGMLLGSWQLVLYPTLLLVGVLLAFALARRTGSVLVPVAVTAVLLALFGALHAMGLGAPSGEGLVLGWDPLTALYLFGIGPVFVLVSLLFVFYGGVGDEPGTGEPRTRATEEVAR